MKKNSCDFVNATTYAILWRKIATLHEVHVGTLFFKPKKGLSKSWYPKNSTRKFLTQKESQITSFNPKMAFTPPVTNKPKYPPQPAGGLNTAASLSHSRKFMFFWTKKYRPFMETLGELRFMISSSYPFNRLNIFKASGLTPWGNKPFFLRTQKRMKPFLTCS